MFAFEVQTRHKKDDYGFPFSRLNDKRFEKMLIRVFPKLRSKKKMSIKDETLKNEILLAKSENC